MRRITRPEVVKGLRAISSDYPDSNNPECIYTSMNGSACCIVGHLLDRLGVDRPIWSSAYNAESFDAWPEWGQTDVSFTDKAIDVIVDVQNRADTDSGCWDRAVHDALL